MATPVEVLLRLRDEATPALGRVAREADQATNSTDGLKKVLQGLGFGGLVNDADDLAAGLGKLGVSSTAATAGLGALASTAVSAMAVAGLAKVIVDIDAAMFDWTLHAKELRAELEGLQHLRGFGAPVDPVVAQSVDDVAMQAQALNAIWTETKATIGEELAPALATAGRGLVALALMAKDAYDAFLALRRIVAETAASAGLFAGSGLASGILGSGLGGYGAEADALTGALASRDQAAGFIAGIQSQLGVGAGAPVSTGGGRPGARRSTSTAGTSTGAFDVAIDMSDLDAGSSSLGASGGAFAVSIAMDDLEATISELDTTVSRANDLAADEAKRAASLASASSGLDAAQRIMGGNLGGIAAMAGPTGAVIGQAIDTLSMLGREGAAGVADNIREAVGAILAGIRELPILLTEELPKLITELIPAMTEAIIESLPALVVAQYEAIIRASVALFRTLFMELPGIIVQAVIEGVQRAWESIKGFFKDPIGSITGGGGIDWGKALTTALRVGAGVATLGLSEIGISAYRGADKAMGGSLPGYARGSRSARSTAPAGSTARTSAGMGGTTINVQHMVGGRSAVRELMREMRVASGSRGLGES